jgi:hypothetical protein
MSLKDEVKKQHKKLKCSLKKENFILCDCYLDCKDHRLGGSEGFFIISEYNKKLGFIDLDGYSHKVAIPIQTLTGLKRYLND